jgi:hypothetical protein
MPKPRLPSRAASARAEAAHEVTNVGSDRSQLATMAKEAKAVLQAEKLDAVADPRLLQRRGDRCLRAGGDCGDVAEADDVRREGRRALRQAGLCLLTGKYLNVNS